MVLPILPSVRAELERTHLSEMGAISMRVRLHTLNHRDRLGEDYLGPLRLFSGMIFLNKMFEQEKVSVIK